jgi:glycopeptide antibiotics resistance protein
MRPALRPRTRLVVRGLFAVYLVGLAVLTMMPEPDDHTAFGWVRTAIAAVAARGVPVTFAGLEATGNVLLFVPFGLLAGLLARPRRWPLVLVAGSATSAAIETIQLAIPGRWTTLQDWVLNTLGTGVGLVVLAVAVRARRGAAEAAPDDAPKPVRP